MSEPPEYLEVKFSGLALTEWRKAFPYLPPGDEIVLKMRPGPCLFCGGETTAGLGGIEPREISETGELIGDFICEKCLKEGR